MKKELNVEQKGTSLAAFLNRRINQMADDDDDRQRIIQEMASAAGIKVDTVNEILNGRIICPPRIRLVAFAEVLDISVDSIISAAERDGCEYDDEKLISCGTKINENNTGELKNKILSFCHKHGFNRPEFEIKDKPISKYCEITRDSETGALSLNLKEAFKELHGQETRLSWKSDQTERCFEANLQAYNEEENKWFDVENIVIQDIEEKAGAVLSKTNKGKLKQAQSLIGEVIAASEPVEAVTEDESDTNSQLPDKGLKEILDRLTLMEKAIDTLAVPKKEEEAEVKDDEEFEIEIEDTPIKEKEIDLDDLEEDEKEKEIDLKDVAQIIGDAIKPMAKEIIKSELRKVTGIVD